MNQLVWYPKGTGRSNGRLLDDAVVANEPNTGGIGGRDSDRTVYYLDILDRDAG